MYEYEYPNRSLQYNYIIGRATKGSGIPETIRDTAKYIGNNEQAIQNAAAEIFVGPKDQDLRSLLQRVVQGSGFHKMR